MSPARLIDPSLVAEEFRRDLAARVKALPEPLTLVGFLATDSAPSLTYASYTKIGCDDVGIRFEMRHVNRHEIEGAIEAANVDPKVHGIIVYYPIFSVERDRYVKDLVDPRKDIEGLHSFWARKLYHNERHVDGDQAKKSILPCTPLAVIKLIAAAGVAPKAKSITIFNRSEVVGRPLAAMLANDGATVHSFDVDGPLLFKHGLEEDTQITREAALASADIVITGVPSRSFPLVQGAEIRPGTLCINFSTLKNFAPEILEKASTFVPRVGPMTVAMALRNTLRLYENYHRKGRA